MEILAGGKLERIVKEVQNDPALYVTCPICDAKEGERCHVQPRVIRFESHRERIHLAGGATVRIFEGRVIKMICHAQFPNGWDAA